MKVLVTSSYYWPELAGSAPYVSGITDHLSECGHDVLVTTGFAHYPDWRSSARRRLGASETRNRITIRRRWHYVPRRQSAAHRAAYELSLFTFGLTALPRRWKPDAILGTCPSLAGGALAAVASKLYRAPYGLVFQDLMGQAAAESGVAGGARVARLVRTIEFALARNAAAVAIVAEGYRRYLEHGGVPPANILRVRNWSRRVPTVETIAETRQRVGWGLDEFVCLHGGNMGRKQGLDNLLDTARLLRTEPVRVALCGEGNDRQRLMKLASEEELTNVDFIAPQADGSWDALLEAADVLLVNQRASVTNMSLPSKLTSYFASGRPVIAAASEDSETASEIETAQAGLVVPPADPEALRKAILALKRDPARAEALGAMGRVYAESVLSQTRALAEYQTFVESLALKPWS